MKKKQQRKQLVMLVFLAICWAISAHYNKIQFAPPAVLKTKAAKTVVADSPLKARFRKIRFEMDALYHYRLKPAPYDPTADAFRLPGFHAQVADATLPKELAPLPIGNAEDILKRAIANIRIGGVVHMNGVIQLTINGQLHRLGDVFTAKVVSKPDPNSKVPPATKSVLIKIKALSDYSTTLALDDPDVGNSELRVRLK